MLLFMGHAVPSQAELAPSKLAVVTQPRVKVCVEFQIKQKTKDLSRRHVLPRTLYPRTRPRSRQQYPPRASNIYKRSSSKKITHSVDVSVSIPRIFWAYLGPRIDRYTTVLPCYRPLDELRPHSGNGFSLLHIYCFASEIVMPANILKRLNMLHKKISYFLDNKLIRLSTYNKIIVMFVILNINSIFYINSRRNNLIK